MFTALVSGTVSKQTGGKFSNGAVTAAFVHLFNKLNMIAGSLANNGTKKALSISKEGEVMFGSMAGGLVSGAIVGSSAGPIGAIAGAIYGLASGMFTGYAINRANRIEFIQNTKKNISRRYEEYKNK